MKRQKSEPLRQYGPFPGVDQVGGVTFDGRRVWFAAGSQLKALDPESGEIVAALDVPADAGTAFDGVHLYQIAEAVIRKIDPATGEVVQTLPAPGGGGDSGLAWAEGALWVGQHRSGQIHKIDPLTGKILHTLTSDRFVTGVTWVEGELWHGVWQDEASEVRRIDPVTGEVFERLEMAEGEGVSGLEWDGGERFFCGGGGSGVLRAIRRPPRRAE